MKKNDVFARWKKRKRSTRILLAILFISLILLVPLVTIAFLLNYLFKCGLIQIFYDWRLYAVWGGIEVFIGVGLLFDYRLRGSRRVKKVNFNLEDSHFMSAQEIEKNEGFSVTRFSELKEQEDGMLIIAERKRNDMAIVLCRAIHAMIIAATGTGKTAAYVSPFIEILSRTRTQPCFVVTDPKGELYYRHARTLKKNGYGVHVVNFADTYHSTLWNPFNDIIRKTDEMRAPIEQKRGKYEFVGKLYDTYGDAVEAKRQLAVRARDEVYIDLQDLIYTCCPVEAAQDKSWQEGARDLIFALALRFWEDYRDGYLPKEKFNIYNLWWNLTTYAKDDCVLLKEYIGDIADENSRAMGMANTVLVSQDRTLASFLASVNQYLHWMADGGIAQLTSGNEIEFMDWDERPNVLFINIPEAKESRRQPVVLLLVQLYKALVEKSNKNLEDGKTKEAHLLRNCYFLMDEFGNLPRFYKLEEYITISRSKHIFFTPVIQDYSQLNRIYGENNARTIRSNCNVNIFMGTNEDRTREEISAGCGKTKTRSVSYNEEKGMSVSTSAQSVPLIYPSELRRLNDPDNGVIGNAVVTIAGNYPIQGKTTPYFKTMDLYGIEELKEEDKREFMFFDENKNRYNIAHLVGYIKFMRSLESTPNADEAMAEVSSEVTETILKEYVSSQIAKSLIRELKKLQTRIPIEEFARLSVASTMQKIVILDELAEKALLNGDKFLAADLDKLRGRFIANSDELIREEQAESMSEGGK